ncbi:MAG: hypothetical protein Q8N05_22725 [Bacteroidota bacterium]|nr:hypothetical protein [Bacteroidota bacterium]
MKDWKEPRFPKIDRSRRLSSDDRKLFTQRLIERPVSGGSTGASFVKIESKETIGRTTGRLCCNRQFLKVQGWGKRLKSRIEQPVVITVVWH